MAADGANRWTTCSFETSTQFTMTRRSPAPFGLLLAALAALAEIGLGWSSMTPVALAAEPPATSFMPVVPTESFDALMKRLSADRKGVDDGQQALLRERYDLSDKSAEGWAMTRGKPVPSGVRVKLNEKATSWAALAEMTPAQIKEAGAWPGGFLPLPHPKHAEGGMVFPAFHIDEIKKQEGRDLTRFDVGFDLPTHLLPEFPPAIFLTTRPDLGDVSKGKVVTVMNLSELFDGILNPKQLDGLRLLLTPFPQQQFNVTDDRRSAHPHRGVSCFDCHVNGHTNGATHLAQDTRPQPNRRRVDTPSLRGVNIQRLFGSQRALKTIEDFTEFEQRGAYFDGDPVIAAKKGINPLERGSQVQAMAEFQELLNFPPAPKLDVFGKLDPALATPEELKGEAIFFGKGRCAVCHPAPYYTDNLMHDLRVERFHKPIETRGRLANADGPIKTFPLRGIKESPPYFHDGRLLTLEDTVEFFNLVLGTRLADDEKLQLVAFLRCL